MNEYRFVVWYVEDEQKEHDSGIVCANSKQHAIAQIQNSYKNATNITVV